tara:strand:+ start:207 stop:380 length:174 start_codon:yes stop_codon:yes gene_type:complete
MDNKNFLMEQTFIEPLAAFVRDRERCLLYNAKRIDLLGLRETTEKIKDGDSKKAESS